MANCGGTHESHGTGQGATQAEAQNRALSHFMATGQAVCAQSSCSPPNTCKFGITAEQYETLQWSNPMQVGDKIRISVSGSGVCFCSE